MRIIPRHPLPAAQPRRPHGDGLRHKPFKILLAREAAIRARRHRPEMLRGRITYRHGRGCPWEKRARRGIALPDVGGGQDPGRDRALSPAAEGGPEQRSVLSRAKALRRPVTARREAVTAPEALCLADDLASHRGESAVQPSKFTGRSLMMLPHPSLAAAIQARSARLSRHCANAVHRRSRSCSLLCERGHRRSSREPRPLE
jgi:hypothetical protein